MLKPDAQFELFFDYTDDQHADVEKLFTEKIKEAISIVEKLERENVLWNSWLKKKKKLRKISDRTIPDMEKEIRAAVRALTKQIVRTRVLTEGKRMDGRGL